MKSRFLSATVIGFCLLMSSWKVPPYVYANWASRQLLSSIHLSQGTLQLPDGQGSHRDQVVRVGTKMATIWGATSSICRSIVRFTLPFKPYAHFILIGDNLDCSAEAHDYMYAAKLLWNVGQRDQAIVAWRQCEGATALLREAKKAIEVGGSQDAIPLLQLAIEVDPRCAECYIVLGEIYFSDQQYADGAEVFNKALELTPMAPELASRLYLGLGEIYFVQGRMEFALSILLEAFAHNPNDSSISYYLGRTYQKLDRPQEAEDAYRTAMQLAPQDLGAHEWLGILLEKSGRCQEALQEYAVVVASSRDSTMVGNSYQSMGHCYQSQGDYLKAQDAYIKSIFAYPQNMSNRLALGDLYMQLGESVKAEETYQQVLEFDPGNQEALKRLSALELP